MYYETYLMGETAVTYSGVCVFCWADGWISVGPSTVTSSDAFVNDDDGATKDTVAPTPRDGSSSPQWEDLFIS